MKNNNNFAIVVKRIIASFKTKLPFLIFLYFLTSNLTVPHGCKISRTMHLNVLHCDLTSKVNSVNIRSVALLERTNNSPFYSNILHLLIAEDGYRAECYPILIKLEFNLVSNYLFTLEVAFNESTKLDDNKISILK